MHFAQFSIINLRKIRKELLRNTKREIDSDPNLTAIPNLLVQMRNSIIICPQSSFSLSRFLEAFSVQRETLRISVSQTNNGRPVFHSRNYNWNLPSEIP